MNNIAPVQCGSVKKKSQLYLQTPRISELLENEERNS